MLRKKVTAWAAALMLQIDPGRPTHYKVYAKATSLSYLLQLKSSKEQHM